jgi:NADH-quinone oxidoreductase subunit C
MADITNESLLERIRSEFGEDIISAEITYGMLSMVVKPSRNIDLLRWLYQDEELQFRFLTDVCGVHFPDQKDAELGVVYHVHSLSNNFRLRFKCFFPVSNPVIASATSLFESANWQERETYDYYGIQFEGHPNLKRILNVDEMDYFPMRREYPLEDGTRTDKEDKYFGR